MCRMCRLLDSSKDRLSEAEIGQRSASSWNTSVACMLLTLHCCTMLSSEFNISPACLPFLFLAMSLDNHTEDLGFCLRAQDNHPLIFLDLPFQPVLCFQNEMLAALDVGPRTIQLAEIP